MTIDDFDTPSKLPFASISFQQEASCSLPFRTRRRKNKFHPTKVGVFCRFHFLTHMFGPNKNNNCFWYAWFKGWKYPRRWRKFWRPEGVVGGENKNSPMAWEHILSEVMGNTKGRSGCRMSWLLVVAFWNYSIIQPNERQLWYGSLLPVFLCDANKRSGTSRARLMACYRKPAIATTRTTRGPHNFKTKSRQHRRIINCWYILTEPNLFATIHWGVSIP